MEFIYKPAIEVLSVFFCRKTRARTRAGFTITELLIALVILGVLAGLVFPILATQVERSYAQEAIQHLDAVKGALDHYKSLNGTYAGATMSNISYDPNQSQAGQTASFSYTLTGVTAAAYKITAQRQPADKNAGNTIVLDQTGVVKKSGIYE